MGLRRLLVFSLFLAMPAAALERIKIVNGNYEHGLPSVGMVFSGDSACTGTLVGCRTVLTAAHCICGTLPANECLSAGLQNPALSGVFFPHAGGFTVESVAVHPGWGSTGGHDLAVLRLKTMVTGIQPMVINQIAPVGLGVTAGITGYGRTGGQDDSFGIKRSGVVQTSACVEPGHICWQYTGVNSSTCQGDSGGPLIVSNGSSLFLAGVTSFGDTDHCLANTRVHDADVYADRAWIASQAGSDLATGAVQCSSLQNAGPPGTIFGSTLPLSTRIDYEAVSLTPGVSRFRVSTSGTGALTTTFTGPGLSATCLGAGSPVSYCEIPNPPTGNYFVSVVNNSGQPNLAQTVWTALGTDAGPSTPAPPAGPWLQTSQLPGYQFKVRINGSAAGTQVADCVPETLCVAGAIPTRAELFLRIIGPRPNGFLWAQAVRFTTSRLEVWVQRLSTGETNYYDMPAVPQDSAELPGLVDKEAFQP